MHQVILVAIMFYRGTPCEQRCNHLFRSSLHPYPADFLVLQAVVVSIDPRRVYLKSPDDVDFKTVRLSNPGKETHAYLF